MVPEGEEEGEDDYDTLPGGPIYEKLFKQKVATKQMTYGNFEIPANIGKLQYLDAFADQGSEVNMMSLTIYTQLTKEVPATTRVRLSFASHSYVYPLGITEDVLVNVAGFMYPVDFMIMDDKENECMPIILGAPFLTTARAVIKYEKVEIELKSGKRKIHFPMTPRYMRESMMERRLKNNVGAPHNHVQDKILAWEARIKSYKEAKLERCRSSDKIHVEFECNQLIENHAPFMEGDLVLLRHLGIKTPPDKSNSWWYGPFTIKNLGHHGIALLNSKRGG